MVVVRFLGKTGGTGVGSFEIDWRFQFDERNVILNLVGFVVLRVDLDAFNLVFGFGPVCVVHVPFPDSDAEFAWIL